MPQNDSLTVLRSLGPRMTKTWMPAGIQQYDRARNFRVSDFEFDSIEGLASTLNTVSTDSKACIIRGRLRDGVAPREDGTYERNLETFVEVPRRWVCLDVDSWLAPVDCDPVRQPELAIETFIRTQLPREFHGVSYYWQLSSSAGKAGTAGILKAHLWFWLDRPISGLELDTWARALQLPVDVTTFRTVQVHYTAAPIFEGVADPVPVRSGLWLSPAEIDEVALVLPDVSQLPTRDRPGRTGMSDPTTKPGLMGAFCRLYPPAVLIDSGLVPGFEFEGDSDSRITWTTSNSGNAGGVCLTDDGAHLYCSHNDDPARGRAVSSWDFARLHLHGHLDDDIDEDALDFMGTKRPSEVAMRAWVTEHCPDVVEARAQADKAERAAKAEEKAEQAVDEVADRERAVARAILEVGKCPSATELETVLAVRLAGLDWSAGERERLAVALKERFKELTSASIPLKDTRAWLRGGVARPTPGTGTATAPDWLERWVYVEQEDLFFDLDSKTTISPRAFDARNTDRMPLRQGNTGLRERASEWAVHCWGIKTVDYTLYAPPEPETFSLGKQRWANEYDPDSVPEAEPGGEAAIRMVQLHLERMFPDQRERELLISWLAHQVRNPGVKVRWAPYIFGVEGVGKTFLGELLEWTIGVPNVRTVSGKTLCGDFTGWAAGKAVTVIEEVAQTGHHYDVAEKLKAPVTNDRIDIHRKGLDNFEAPNYSNYLLLSNHADGIPVTANDRRYMFMEVSLSTAEATALSQEGYFESLFASCRAHQGQLRRWLLCDAAIHPEFAPSGRAPVTQARAMVIELSKTDPELGTEDLLRGRNAVSSTWLASKLRSQGIEVRTRSLSKLLSQQGFRLADRLRFGGAQHRIWTRSGSPSGLDCAQLRSACAWMGIGTDVFDSSSESED